MRKPAKPARPTSAGRRARADIITAPSTPKKQKSVTIIVFLICSATPSVDHIFPQMSAVKSCALKEMAKTPMIKMSITTLTKAKRELTVLAVRMPRATMKYISHISTEPNATVSQP